MSTIKLGQMVRDKITEYEGVAAVEADHMFGCTQFGVAKLMTESGEIKDMEFFDEGRLERIGEGVPNAESGVPNWPTSPKLGNEVKDKITGFSGIVVVRARYLYGDIRMGISPKVKDDGEIKQTEFFDHRRLDVVSRGIAPEEVQAEKKGGISRDIPRGVR